jgi:hypothetical protein
MAKTTDNSLCIFHIFKFTMEEAAGRSHSTMAMVRRTPELDALHRNQQRKKRPG